MARSCSPASIYNAVLCRQHLTNHPLALMLVERGTVQKNVRLAGALVVDAIFDTACSLLSRRAG